jgi:signal transduction histidine kinase
MPPSTTLVQSPPDSVAEATRGRGVGLLRSIPIHWRILSIGIINTVAVLAVGALIVIYANKLSGAWTSLTQARNTDRILVALGADVERVQGLIHRYLSQPSETILATINRQREDLLRRVGEIQDQRASTILQTNELAPTIQRLFVGFDSLKTTRALIVQIHESEVLKPAGEMAGLYAILTNSTTSGSLLWPALSRSRDSYATALVAANSFYLSQGARPAFETRENLAAIERTAPVMESLAETDLQRDALRTLRARASAFMTGFNRLAAVFSTQDQLLQAGVDDTQQELSRIIGRLSAAVRNAEDEAEARFDRALEEVYTGVGLLGLAFMAASIAGGMATARSIQGPMDRLKSAMQDIMAGRFLSRVDGVEARDQIGDMARAVQVFQENSIARYKAEEELRLAKERAEATLVDLRDAQRNLIEAEKFAALGSLVAGVAHEVNGPVGISLTVASSLAHRCQAMDEALSSSQPLLRSSFVEFVRGNREAASQLVTNLQRAGELVESFKQVAVDRTHVERRTFDLAETTHQIVVSLLPGSRKRQISVDLDATEGLILDSYPGPYGQVLTNLFLNSFTHAFPDGDGGAIKVEVRSLGLDHVGIAFEDNGRGMSPETRRRAFEPFFTTRRQDGGTGLGLHIVYNLVTHRLGGRITVESEPGVGTRFRIVLPRIAPTGVHPAT